MKPTYLFLALLFFFSCSNNDNKEITDALDIQGKLLAPNNLDPIANAKVSVLENNAIIFETSTNASGDFTISIPEGDYQLHLNKGLFSTQKSISVTENTTLETYRIENLPSIGVVTGNFDNIESILYSIGLVDVDTGAPLFDIIDGMSYDRLASEPVHGHHSSHQHSNMERNNPLLEPNVDFTYQQLLADPALLSSYDIIFINCGVITGDYDGGQNLYDFVNNGGYLYATDWASKALETITNNGSDFVTFYTPERSGSSLSTTANILNDDLIAWLQYFGITDTDTVEIDEFLGSWQVIDTYDSATTYSWLDGPVVYYNDLGDPVEETKDLALTFPLGNGGVLYSSFHTENTDPDFTITDRIMEYMVFEMSAVE